MTLDPRGAFPGVESRFGTSTRGGGAGHADLQTDKICAPELGGTFFQGEGQVKGVGGQGVRTPWTPRPSPHMREDAR